MSGQEWKKAMHAINGNDGKDDRVEKVTRKWIRSQGWNVPVLSDGQIADAKRGIAFLTPRIARHVDRELMGSEQGKRGAVAVVSPARKLEDQEGRQIKVVVIEENKRGAGVATVKDLYVSQYAKEGVEQVERVETTNVKCDRQPIVTVIVRKARSGEQLWKEAYDT